MTPRELILSTAALLREYDVPDPVTDSTLLLSSLMGKSPLELRADFESEVPEDVQLKMKQLSAKRITRYPLQYSLNETPFCGRMFYIDKGALIPRPETELLCYWALELLPRRGRAEVLDLCTGSGCIGLTIKMERPETHLTLLDLSPEALEIAERNRELYSLDVRIVQSNLFSALPSERIFDMILSNPPYIPESSGEKLQPEVSFEPDIALYGGDDGLDFYRNIAKEAAAYLKPGGILIMELGDGEAEAVAGLLQDHSWSGVEIRKDFAGKARMIKAVCEV